jgi:hypothetical protein
VTTIRTTGSSSPYADINLKRDVDAGRRAGPHIVVTSPYLEGPEAGGTHASVATEQQARQFVAYWDEEGADWIKFYVNISRSLLKAAIDEAHKRGMRAHGAPVLGDVPRGHRAGPRRLRAWGAHGHRLHRRKKPDECPQNTWAVLDTAVKVPGPIATPLIDLMVKKKVSMTTTLPVYEAFYPKRPVTDERTLELMAPRCVRRT